MNTEIYLRAELDGVRFAVPAAAILKILSDPAAVPVPDAPEGICGIAYDAGAIFAIRSFSPKRRVPAQLVILCRGGAEAYAADCVEAMETLTGDELANALPAGDAGILLLDGKERND